MTVPSTGAFIRVDLFLKIMKNYRSDDRLIGFRINNEFVNYLVGCGAIPHDWDEMGKEGKTLLVNAVQKFLSDFATGKSIEIESNEVPDLMGELKNISERLRVIEGKAQPKLAS